MKPSTIYKLYLRYKKVLNFIDDWWPMVALIIWLGVFTYIVYSL